MRGNHTKLQQPQLLFSADPVQVLHQISLQDAQESTPQKQAAKFSSSRKPSNPVIFNKKSGQVLEDAGELSQWKATALKEQQIFAKKTGNGSAKKQLDSCTSSFHLQKLGRKSVGDENGHLSLADLCHRYTFINQHSSWAEFSQLECQSSEKRQLQPKSIQLKLQSPRSNCSTKYQANHRVKKRSLHNIRQQLRLPQVCKSESQAQNSWKPDRSHEIKNMLEMIRRSMEKEKKTVTCSSEEKTKQGTMIHDRKSQPRHKINWKTNQRYNPDFLVEKREHPGTEAQPVGSSRLVKKQVPAQQQRDCEGMTSAQQAISRDSKSLEQCLVLSKQRKGKKVVVNPN